MQANSVELTGFKESIASLQGMGAEITEKVVVSAMNAGANILTDAVSREAYFKLKGRKKSFYTTRPHLFETIGKKTKKYSDKGVVFVAAGPLHRLGGYHGHLVELGHKIVTGGTIGYSGRKAAITSIGKRYLESLGFTSKKGGYYHKTTGRKRYRFGDTFENKQIRGGGKIHQTAVPPHPFTEPAWMKSRGKVLNQIEKSIESNLVRQARSFARAAGVIN